METEIPPIGGTGEGQCQDVHHPQLFKQNFTTIHQLPLRQFEGNIVPNCGFCTGAKNSL